MFYFYYGHEDFFVCFFMDGHPQAMVVLFPCSHSQGFKKATMAITLLNLLHLFLVPRWMARGGVMHIQVSARDESGLTGDRSVLYGRWLWYLLLPETETSCMAGDRDVCVCVFILYALWTEYDKKSVFPQYSAVWTRRVRQALLSVKCTIPFPSPHFNQLAPIS